MDVDADKDGAEGATTLHASSSTSSLNVIRPTWEIRHEDLEEKDKVGRGSTGDFVHCLWNNQNVRSKNFTILMDANLICRLLQKCC